ncbi:AAA family ATPase [Sutcliffiella deserti]|uniref:AAA family ATPase n=1 Tax=Sutcliffiella deserti TaxID=2875501 RepID=UPI001CC0B94F|nr:ATP-binding protein [Sutcliffiella deserti]
MNYLINEIVISDEKYNKYQVSTSQGDKKIQNLSKINIFVGSNNSGKSRMLRYLFTETPAVFTPSDISLQGLNSILRYFKDEVRTCITSKRIVDYDSILESVSRLEELGYIVEDEDYLSDLFKLIKKLENISGHNSITSQGTTFSSFDYDSLNKELRDIAQRTSNGLEDIYSVEKYSFHRVYIPTLRGLRTLDGNRNHYLDRTKSDYFGSQEHVDVFTGLELYEDIKKLLLGSLDDREKIAEFQEFLGRVFFAGEQITLVPSINSDVLNVKIGEEREQPIHKLGDGIQSIIILTFPIFKYRDKNVLMFIEEPELYLHPGLQRKLIETMVSEVGDSVQYFITTHSNHFLDLTLDIEQISIYSFDKELEDTGQKEKDAKFYMDNVSNEDNNVLEMLGVRNSSVFLSNCTIWVEGITDRYYLRHFLQIYIDSIDDNIDVKEDFHFSFVEYSGNNITHWSFLDDEETEAESPYSSMNVEKLCRKLLLITDKDSERKLSRQQKLEEKLGESYYCLNCKEIENILPKTVLLKVIADYENVCPEELQFSTDFSELTYQDQYLGKFIDDNLINKRRRGNYGSDSGTISSKLSFCKKAILHTKGIDDLSEEANELCAKIYQFIKDNN